MKSLLKTSFPRPNAYMSQSLQLIQNTNLLLSVQHANDHMCAFAPHVFINRQKPAILAVKKDTGQAAAGGHNYLNRSHKVSRWKLPTTSSFFKTLTP